MAPLDKTPQVPQYGMPNAFGIDGSAGRVNVFDSLAFFFHESVSHQASSKMPSSLAEHGEQITGGTSEEECCVEQFESTLGNNWSLAEQLESSYLL